MAVSSSFTPRRSRARWLGRLRLSPLATDVLLAAALAAAVVLAALTAEEPGAVRWDPAGYLLGIGLGVVTLLRRRWAVAVLLVSTSLVLGYHALGFPAIGSWPLAVALYTCAAAGRLWAPIAVGVVIAWTSAWARLLLEPEPVLRVLSSGVQELAFLGLAIAFGDAVRSRRGWTAEAHERVRRLERDRERETQRMIVEERVRIARELHDITAHTLAVAGIQLNVAADTMNDSPDEARSALRTAQQANREATAELKAAVRVLRQEQGDALPRSPTPGLEGVGPLLEAAREAGLRVTYEESGPVRPLPTSVGLTAYRVIQESITNVLRHAHAAAVHVRIGYEPTGLSVRITDDGQGPQVTPRSHDADGQTGYGIIGMRERTLGLGGEFAAGPDPEGGFDVRAWVPIEPAR